MRSVSRVARRIRLPDAALLLILLLGLVLRLQHLNLPMAEAHRWRAVTNADIARNFAERSMNLLYPQVNWGGGNHPYVGMEFPLMHWIVALFYQMFGERPVIGRVVSIAFSVATIWATFALGSRLFGVPVGRAAAFLIAISPSAVFFGRVFISDTPMLFFSVAAVLGWITYFDTGATRAAVAGAIASALAFLVKIPAVMILVPIVWAAWEARRWGALRDRRLVIGLSAAVAAAALWYWHADAIYHRTGLAQAIWHPSGSYPEPIASAAGSFVGISHWSTLDQLRNPDFYETLLVRAWALHLTPGGFILALYAGLSMWRRPRRRIVDAWLGIVLVFVLVTAEGHRHHEFHQLPMLPPAALLFGLAAAPAFDGAWLRAYGGRVAGPVQSAAALLLIALLSFKFSGVIEHFFRPNSLDMGPIHAGRAIKRALPRSALVVTVEYEKFGNNSPILLYWADRRGWSFDFGSITPEVIALLKNEHGARYFVTTLWHGLSVTRPEVADYLRTRRQVPLNAAPENTVVFDLLSEATPESR